MTTHSSGTMPTSVADLDKHLPGLPNLTFDMGEEDSGLPPTGVVSHGDPARIMSGPRTRIPQFRQSRRWARRHGWAEPPTPPPHPLRAKDSFLDDNPTADDVKGKQLSKREKSFEQQRAVLRKTHLQRPIPVEETKRPTRGRSITESTIDTVHNGAVWNRTAECWRFVKPTVSQLPRPGRQVWPRKRSMSRKTTPAKRREAGRGPAAIISLPVGIRTQNANSGRQRDDAVSKRVTSTPARRRSLSVLKGRSHRQNEGARGNLTISLIPSLHDPLKDRTFSDECREMLRSLGSNSDWLLASRRSLLCEGWDLMTPGRVGKRLSLQSQHRRSRLQQDTNNGSESVIAGPARASVILHHTGPIAKPSSATLDDLAGMQPTHQTTTSWSVSQSPNRNVRAAADGQNRPDQQQENVAPSLGLRPARSIMSIDTLAGIEAQVHGALQPEVDSTPPKKSMESSVSNAVYKYRGPPPDIPLPALPPEALDKQSTGTRSSGDEESLMLRRESSATSVEYTRRTLSGPRAEKVRARRMRDLADSRSQSEKSSIHTEQETASKQMPANAVLDELDRFPAVPDSCSASIASISVRSALNHQQSTRKRPIHQVRRMSTSSSAGRPPKPSGQILSQSNIFVVVDSNPVTALFRAGAMSPAPSIGGHGRSPERNTLECMHKPSKLKDLLVHKMGSLESIRSETTLRDSKGQQSLTPGQRPGSRPSGNNKRPATSDSRLQHSSSDEQAQTNKDPTSSHKVPKKSKKRRRWNSDDINLIMLLNQDLEAFYTKIRDQEEIVRKQEEKIKWQAHQIQMMSRVFAPMDHARGERATSLLADSPQLPPMSGETQALGAIDRNSWSGSRDWRQPDTVIRSPLSIIGEQTLNIHGQRKPLGQPDPSGTTAMAEVLLALNDESAQGVPKAAVMHEPTAKSHGITATTRYYRS
ncbi:hypothetical protein A1O7_02894 [Cladophialophora yegresii CBS 114405]|uniref:Uncharacterized protein n=1 Tax=Cladophialophora yegresii CBS 114405 TaxID=1182544 RepID=W9W315_9EURO|nr:uncharacterized protein A1O7_02894 [Cladophialophora yegresii CBS 114405]EXJ62457.1 hypothetical protein A1O7_02894 [Cladophialophora yegresii CBS 114405]